jgi:enoyl-CoA hydratase/carnithine racemase
MVALSRVIGRKRALEMLLTGEPVDAHRAEETRQLAGRIAQASDLVVALGKQAFYTQVDLDQPRAYENRSAIHS